MQSRGTIGRIFHAMGLVVSGKAGAGLLSLVYLFLATRYLGPTNYGVLVLVHGYVMLVCGIIAFPAAQAVIRYGAEANRDGDPHRLSRLLRFGAKVELTGGVLAIIAAWVLAPIVGPKLGWSPKAMAFAQVYSFAALGSVRSTPAGYLQLLRRFDLIGLHNLVQPVVRLLGVLFVMASGYGTKSFLVAWLAAAVAEFAVLWGLGIWQAWKHLGPALWRHEPGDPREENPGLWRFLFASNADVTLSELAGRVTPLAVGWVLGPAMAGMFAVAQRATVIIAQPAQILGSTAYSELAHMVAAGDGGAPLRRTLLRVIFYALLAAAPVVLLVIFIPDKIVQLFAGKQFIAASTVMIVLVVARTIAMIGPPCSSALTALGKPALSMSANLFASLIFLPLLPLLLQRFGLMGAGIQALAQAMLASALLAGLVWRQSGKIISPA